MRTKSRLGLFTMVGAAGALLLAACSPTAGPAPAGGGDSTPGGGSTATEGSLPAVTVGLSYVPNVQFSPFYYALEQGYFEDAGVDVTLRHHGAQEDIFGALQRGDEDLVYASVDEAVVGNAGDYPFRIAAQLYASAPNSIIVPESSDIQSAEDLRGSTIGIPMDTPSARAGLLSTLATAGLTTDDITLEVIGFTQVTALAAGRVDAVVGFANNEALQLDAGGTPVRLIEYSTTNAAGEPVPFPGPALVTTPNFDAEPATLAAIRDAVLRAQREIAGNPELGVDASVAEVPTLADPTQRETALQVLTATVPYWGENAVITPEGAWDAPYAFAQQLASVGGIAEGDVGTLADYWVQYPAN